MIKHPLDDIVKLCERQSEQLGIARNAYLGRKAEKRNLESRLQKESGGKSQAEREMLAYATQDWLDFEKDLARLEAVYEFQRDKLEVLNKEYQAQYLELKESERSMRRQGA